MNVLKKKIYDPHELKQRLMDCICEAQGALSRKTVNLHEARGLLAYIGDTRALLLKVHEIQNSPYRPDLPGLVEQLQERMVAFEDVLKEGIACPLVNRSVVYADKKSA